LQQVRTPICFVVFLALRFNRLRYLTALLAVKIGAGLGFEIGIAGAHSASRIPGVFTGRIQPAGYDPYSTLK
jgi:hypothetical protein